MCKERQSSEERVGQYREDERTTATQSVADDTEERATERPAEQEGRLHIGAIATNVWVSL